MKFRNQKLWALGLAATMVAASFTGCGNNTDADTNTTTAAGPADSTTTAKADDPATTPDPNGPTSGKRSKANVTAAPTTRNVTIGAWYDFYYTSKDDSVDDDPNQANEEQGEAMLQSIRDVEERYNCTVEVVNLTYEGTRDSINTSIMAGTPDCDIYLLDNSFGVPAVLNGYAEALEDYVAEDDDVWGDQVIMTSMKLPGSDKTYMFAPQSGENVITGLYYLGCNLDLITQAGLENPQDLWDNNEWTWDKFEEYCLALTDSAKGTYGIGGRYTNFFIQLVMSNGGAIAEGPQQGIDSPATIEAMDFFSKLASVDKVTQFNIDDWNTNETNYTDGKTAFWVTAQWISDSNADKDLPFEIAWVPFPIGPSGNKETNFYGVVGTTFYMIPKGAEDPTYIYNVFEDWKNWYNGDTSFRDSDMTWWEDCALTERNYQYCWEAGKNRNHLDLWDSIGVDQNYVTGLITGEMTAAQAAEQYKQLYDDACKTYFGGN